MPRRHCRHTLRGRRFAFHYPAAACYEWLLDYLPSRPLPARYGEEEREKEEGDYEEDKEGDDDEEEKRQSGRKKKTKIDVADSLQLLLD